MPYIKQEIREKLDDAIVNLAKNLRNNCNKSNLDEELSNEELLEIIGDINYSFSRVASLVMGKVSYSKIALITGVLENIKQEFYERIARKYEDKKINENGDIPEYFF